MRIGVVSDTHSKVLPRQMLEDFRHVDLILHAGDFCELADWERFKKITQTEGVCGNMDGPGISRALPPKRILQLGKYRIGLTHGGGPPKHLLDKVRATFVHDKVDAVVFGHSHHAMNEKIEGVLYFNPGSPTDEIFTSQRSYGILELTDAGLEGRIIEVQDER